MKKIEIAKERGGGRARKPVLLRAGGRCMHVPAHDWPPDVCGLLTWATRERSSASRWLECHSKHQYRQQQNSSE